MSSKNTGRKPEYLIFYNDLQVYTTKQCMLLYLYNYIYRKDRKTFKNYPNFIENLPTLKIIQERRNIENFFKA